MSRLWDTPEFWARTEVDELLRDHPLQQVAELAASFDRIHPRYERDPQFARDIVVELLKRAAAGVRFWPDAPEIAEIERDLRLMFASQRGSVAERQDGEIEESGPDATVPWWQSW
jgi:hypothetical protein